MKQNKRTVLRAAALAALLALGCESAYAAEPTDAAPGVTMVEASLPADRVSPYSAVCFGLTSDEAYMRRYIGSLRDLGCTQALALIYWWQHEKLEGDWWKGKYPESMFGENYLKMIDLFVDLCNEMGIRPALRLGDFNRQTGLWHPADPSGDIEPYTEWVGRMVSRYRGKVDHYVIGDELKRGYADWWKGTPEQYLRDFVIPISQVIRANDPQAKISSCGTEPAGWQLELIRLGLPDYADGVALNLWRRNLENLELVTQFMRDAKALWPEVKFYSNGVGYGERVGLNDRAQAARIAQTMFDLWDLGWDSAPNYVYRFSVTADTNQDFGLIGIPMDDEPLQVTDAWRAYQTIAHTYYNRDEMVDPDFEITLEPAQTLTAEDGTAVTLAPPDVLVRSYIRDDDDLLIYLVYRNTRQPAHGVWNVVIHSDQWDSPKRIPWNDHRQRIEQPTTVRDGARVVGEVPVSNLPTTLILKRHAAR